MQLSKRIQQITTDGSDGWEILYKSRAMIAKGQDVLELTIGEHDIRTDPKILAAMHQSALGGHTGYASVPGTPELRRAVAARVQERTGVPTSHKNVLITPGGQAGLFAAILCATDPGDGVVHLDPYYATYPTSIRAASCVPMPIKTGPENDFQPSAADLATRPEGARAFLMNSPNNPTGNVYSTETIEAVAEYVQNNDLTLISDEVYDTQIWSGAHVSPRALPNMAERTIVIGSMSKSHAMTGSRIGWVIAPEGAIENMIDLATNTTYGVAGFVQDAALFALSQGEVFEEKIAASFKRRREIALSILQGFPNIPMIAPRGGMYLMLDVRKTGLSGIEFANRLLDERSIAVMPGESFGDSAAGHIRVAMTITDDRFGDALRGLCEYAESLMHG
ncbi:aspartate/tyrosine/aromatic aminotransferase [Rhodobacteraceae bacterium HIMB11]|nr:aspartate/tyrosine/aromatic aminotransferase [Rhodobacteraceae bacterium HIMB11]